jgi:hypothetical protein
MEVVMAFITGDVVANPGGKAPFKVVFKQGETVLTEWAVESQAMGQEEMAAAIRGLSEGGDHEDDSPDAKGS